MRTRATRDVKGWCGLALSMALLLAMLSAAPAQAQLSDRIRINGYSSFEWEYQLSDHDTGRGDKNGSFDADLFDLVFNVQPTDRLRVAADLTWEHGAASEDGRGNVAAEYAFAEYKVADALRLRAGKMFVPFGIYNEIHTAKPLFLSVKEPVSTNKIEKMGSSVRFYPRWGSGLAAIGSGQVSGKDWDYVIQLANGDQRVAVATDAEYPNPFDEDNNTSKSAAARIRFHPWRDVTLGASVYRDVMNEYDELGTDTGKHTDLLSYGGHASWNGRRAGLELEYVRGHFQTSDGSRVDRDGLSAMVFANLGRVRPYLRYEAHDPDHDIADNEADLILGGLNVRIEHGLYVKAELDHYTSGVKNKRFKGVPYTEFKASISYGF
jgi:hypothetical protein